MYYVKIFQAFTTKVMIYRLGGLADSIFTSMDPKTPEAYCAMIQGMAKYYQVKIIPFYHLIDYTCYV